MLPPIATRKKLYILVGILAIISAVYLYGISGFETRNTTREIRIGYFHGGRTNIIYRAYINNEFERGGVSIELRTMNLGDKTVFKVPKNNEKFALLSDEKLALGKMKGTEIIEKITEGEFDGGTVGESSFLVSIYNNAPIVGVALLGYNRIPGKAILIRNDLVINSPEDLKGKTLISRRAGPGDAIFLREFLKDVGLEPEKDVTIIDQVNDHQAVKWLRQKKIDGGLYHLVRIRKIVEDKFAYIYRPMDWIDSQLSAAILVFHKDFITEHPDKVQKFVTAYMERIQFERELSEDEKDNSWDKGLMMVGEYEGMSIPSYDYPPRIKLDKLYEMQDILVTNGVIGKKVKIEDFIDDRFVKSAYEMVK